MNRPGTSTVSDVTEPRVIGQEWTDTHPDKYRDHTKRIGVPCLICGHPTGDCAPHMEEPVPPKPKAKKQPIGSDVRPVGAAPRRRDEPVGELPEGFARVPESLDLICATRDVYLQFIPKGVTRTSTVLAFPRGAVTTVEGYHDRVGMYAHHSALEVK